MTLLLLVAAFAAEPPPLPKPRCPDAEAQEAQTAELEARHQALTAALAAGDEKAAQRLVSATASEYRAGRLCADVDRWWAALTLLASTRVEDADASWVLAQHLIAGRYPRATWLGGQAYDRQAIARGAMQAYGTQTAAVNGRRCLLWVDPAFTDAQRATYGFPPLADTAASILALNGATGAPATVAELKKRELWCKPERWDGGRSDLQDPYGR